MSDVTKVDHPDWGFDECVEYLREFAAEHPGQTITLRYFKQHATVTDETWSRRFGTFLDYKRGAGLSASGKGVNMPMSENQQKFQEDWGPEDCLVYLRDFAERRPTQVISRNFFRNEASI